jgi:hypothetical protein
VVAQSRFLLDSHWNRCEAVFAPAISLKQKIRAPIFYVGAAPGAVWIRDVTLEALD